MSDLSLFWIPVGALLVKQQDGRLFCQRCLASRNVPNMSTLPQHADVGVCKSILHNGQQSLRRQVTIASFLFSIRPGLCATRNMMNADEHLLNHSVLHLHCVPQCVAGSWIMDHGSWIMDHDTAHATLTICNNLAPPFAMSPIHHQDRLSLDCCMFFHCLP
jgi:hypothetical protein